MSTELGQIHEYGTSAALVDAYAAEIQELTGKYDENGAKLSLTADEQQRLKLAVEGFNEQTGTSISVTDALNGVLDRSVDSVMASAEAFKEQARQQAAMELYKDMYKQQLEDTMALEDATKALTEADKGLGIWIGDFPVIADEASVAYHDLEKNVEDLTEAHGSAERSMDQLLGVMSGTGKTFESFDAALEQSGVSLSDFGALTDEQLEAIRGGFDGKLSSIVRTCGEKGIEIPQSLAAAITANKGAVGEASEGLGADVDAGIQKGIDDTSDRPKSAIASLGDGLVDTFKSLLGIHSPSTVMAEAGADIDLGLQQGIDGSRSFPESAMASVGQLLQGAVQGLPEWMRQLGSDAGSLLSSGISSLSSAVQSAGGLLSASGQSGAAPLAQGLGSTGTQAGSMLASGLNSLAGYALSAGANLSSSAQSGANPAVGAMGGIGSSAASGFSSAIARASAYQSARNLADTARSGAGSVSAYGAGQNFSRGFASGIGGVSVWSAAYNVGMSALGAIKSALGIASPSKEAAKVGAWFGEGAIVGMRSTEAAIDAESRRMSEAMSLEPAVGAWGYAQKYASAYGAAQNVGGSSRQIAFNVTINVTASDARSAAAIGRSLGDELYLEFARRERAHA
ncbi:MAG: hypothetical protein SOW20_05775 [Berryella intestinalis]|uniref:hypothetical protein n=1 Tax=Berryella intestinalis TaxID=1531429 RepID=UPI002A75DC9F|nr:hypothetical protein [Berryella intestinalis]MDY3129512.1 hypothetical protein [Berryella intestinalis]